MHASNPFIPPEALIQADADTSSSDEDLPVLKKKKYSIKCSYCKRFINLGLAHVVSHVGTFHISPCFIKIIEEKPDVFGTYGGTYK